MDLPGRYFPLLNCYGTLLIATPNINNLAESGVLYTEAGYFTFNNGKDDYNFSYDRRDLYDQDYSYHPLYGKRGDRLEIGELIAKEPFFGQIQLSGGKEIFSSSFKDNVSAPVARTKIELSPYLPDYPAIVEEYANHLDAIQITDNKVGKILNELEENGMLTNTIIFFFSDHGMRLTRHKQFLYDGGLLVPLIIADFSASGSRLEVGTTNNELIAGIDLGPSALTLAGILDQWIMDTDDKGQYPESMEGLKLMLGIWGKNAINPEYDPIRKQFSDLEGSLVELKSQPWKKVGNE